VQTADFLCKACKARSAGVLCARCEAGSLHTLSKHLPACLQMRGLFPAHTANLSASCRTFPPFSNCSNGCSGCLPWQCDLPYDPRWIPPHRIHSSPAQTSQSERQVKPRTNKKSGQRSQPTRKQRLALANLMKRTRSAPDGRLLTQLTKGKQCWIRQSGRLAPEGC
jgi:hypothetical protein